MGHLLYIYIHVLSIGVIVPRFIATRFASSFFFQTRFPVPLRARLYFRNCGAGILPSRHNTSVIAAIFSRSINPNCTFIGKPRIKTRLNAEYLYPLFPASVYKRAQRKRWKRSRARDRDSKSSRLISRNLYTGNKIIIPSLPPVPIHRYKRAGGRTKGGELITKPRCISRREDTPFCVENTLRKHGSCFG